MESIEDIESVKLRLDYAWSYFESAARQRMLFFNYFLVIVGILASAYGLAVKENIAQLAVFVGILGTLASVAFISFDLRTRGFVALAGDVLEKLEREHVFPDGYSLARNQASKIQLGLLRRDYDDERMREGQPFSLKRFFLKEKTWIRMIEVLACLGFALGVYSAIMDAKDNAIEPLKKDRLSVLASDQTTKPSISPVATQSDAARRFYVAGHSQQDAKTLMCVLVENGCEVTSRWITEDAKFGQGSEAYTHEEKLRIALMDEQDVRRACSGVILLAEAEGETVPGGKHVETGMALAMGRPVYVVGRRENIFHWHPLVRLFATSDQLVEFLVNTNEILPVAEARSSVANSD